MTQIKGSLRSMRRANALGAHSLDHFNVAVPDFTKAQTFNSPFGLNAKADGETLFV
jgi:hypothetical protein